MQIDGSKGEKQTKPEKKILSSKNINNKLLSPNVTLSFNTQNPIKIDLTVMLIIRILQGGQNFYEKVRTFPEQIRTIRTFYWKKSVKSVKFF